MSKRRVLCGGSYFSLVARLLRTSFRYGFEPEGRYRPFGFRVVVKRRKP